MSGPKCSPPLWVLALWKRAFDTARIKSSPPTQIRVRRQLRFHRKGAAGSDATLGLTGHVWTAPLRQVLSWRGDDCGRVRSCVWPVGAAILHDCWP
jgi:hypothetical protein